MENLKRIKKATLEWAKAKKLKEEEDLGKINEELDFLESPEGAGYASIESRDIVKSLETSRRNILLEREET